MGSILFVVRTLALTFVLVVLMQIHWKGKTIEDHTMGLLTSATLATPIEKTADGAVIFVRNSWTRLTQMLNTNFSNSLRRENQPGTRHEKFKIKRNEKIDETYVPGQSDASAVEE